MIDERHLTKLMEQAARAYQVPEGGPAAVLEAAGVEVERRPTETPRSPRRTDRRPRWIAAAAAVVVLFLGAVVVNVGTGRGGETMRLSDQAGPAPRPQGRSLATGGTDSSDQQFNSGLDEDAGSPLAPTGLQAESRAASPARPTSAAGAAPGAGGDVASAAQAPAPDALARVVKTATVDIEVGRGRFSAALDRLSALAVGRGGFVTQTETSESGDAPSGTVTLRIPAGGFDEAVSEVRRLGKVQSASSRGQDVTARYSDLEARLRALGATRDQILTVLSKANAVGDILAVQERLNSVQVQIEQLQGQQKLLDDQTTFGTLAVRLAEPGAGGGLNRGAERSGLAGAWDDARDGFVGGVEAIVAGSGTALILLLSLGALALAARGAWVLARRRLV
ncbi:MAG: hypothetical protein CYG61_02745 [Actinobacteria bacterium]|nr:MAG: hypothetical protein CYG61_02745 [Actinomycetota bacterium]